MQNVGRDSRVKDLEFVASGRDIGYADVAARIRDRIIRRRQSDHHGAHLGMNIAEDERNSRLVELHEARGSTFIQTQIEAFTLEQRKDIVEERIAVRKFDFAEI